VKSREFFIELFKALQAASVLSETDLDIITRPLFPLDGSENRVCRFGPAKLAA
jgi:hypothetical protein